MNNTGVESIVASLQVPGSPTCPRSTRRPGTRATAGFFRLARRVDGFPFYASPITADVAGLGLGRSPSKANDTYFIHAFQASGLEAPGFPSTPGSGRPSQVWSPIHR